MHLRDHNLRGFTCPVLCAHGHTQMHPCVSYSVAKVEFTVGFDLSSAPSFTGHLHFFITGTRTYSYIQTIDFYRCGSRLVFFPMKSYIMQQIYKTCL